ncbi:type I restriction enzyme S subunit [Bradyrhizobium barranii subsp. barranii]|uniref:restriction endonuclease subunit S n=1 Tax=Bradyrhizobium TaxID=374 RepID=UPI001BAD2D18|nr:MULTISPECIES: restriction endonuclease subunit S [Bradyrhizobium]MCP1958138.1 type I restriction enzyme S subunit [Bradyrhizobium japonicum]
MSTRIVRLDDICEINPRMPKTLPDDAVVSFLPMAAVSEEGFVDFEERRELREVRKGYTYFERGDVLVAKITPCFENGKAARTSSLNNPIGFGSTEFHVLRAGREIEPSYLFHLIWNSKLREVGAKNMTGSAGQKRVPADFLKRLEIPLSPLHEQRRIAAILDKADALRRKRKSAIELLDGLTQSIFQQMFGSTSQFELKPLATIIDQADRINYGVVQPGDEVSDGVNLIRVSDLKNGLIDHTNLRKVSRAISDKHSRSLLRGNEILISCVGSIGEIATASLREAGFNIARAVARVPISDDVLRAFVADYLRSSVVQQYFTKELRTVSQPTLNIKQISETLIPMPPPSKLREFLERRDAVRSAVAFAQQSGTSLDFLFSSLQHRAFSGQL